MNPGQTKPSGGIGINVSSDGNVVFQVNRAERRRLKRALKLPFTPTAEFTAQYLERMSQEQAAKRAEPTKVRIPRAWADAPLNKAVDAALGKTWEEIDGDSGSEA